jgi:hypothetical protein
LAVVLATEQPTPVGNLSILDVVWRDIVLSSGVEVVARLGLWVCLVSRLCPIDASVRLSDDAFAIMNMSH